MRSFTEELISRVSSAASAALVRIGAVPDYSVEKQDYDDEPLLSRILSLVVPPAFLALIDHPGQCFFAPDPDVPFALLRLICAELTASSIPTPVKCKVLDPQETSVPASPSFAPSSPCTSFVASTPATTSTSPTSETPASSVHASPSLSPASLGSEIVENGEQELEAATFRGLLAFDAVAKSDEAKNLPHTTSSSASCAAPVAPTSSPVNASLTTSMSDLSGMFAGLELDEAKNLPHTTSSSASCAAPVAPTSSPVNASLTTSMADLSGMFAGLELDEAKNLPHTTSSSASCAAPVAPASSPVNASLTTSMADLGGMFAALELAPAEAKSTPVEPVDKILHEPKEEKVKKVRFATKLATNTHDQPIASSSGSVVKNVDKEIKHKEKLDKKSAKRDAKRAENGGNQILDELKEKKDKKEARRSSKLATNSHDQPIASSSSSVVDKEIKHKEKHDKKSAKRDAKRAENGGNQILDESKEKKDKKEARLATKLATNTRDQPTASGSTVENVDKEIKHKEKLDKKSAKRDAKRAENGGNQILDELKEKKDKKEARLATKLATNTRDQPTASGSTVENVDKEIKHKEKLDKKSAKRDAKRAENGGNQILDELKEKKDKKEARLATKLATNTRDQPTASGSTVENVDKEIKHKEKLDKKSAKRDAKRAENGGNQILDELKEKKDKKEARLATKLATNTHDQPTASGSLVKNINKEIKNEEKLAKKKAQLDAERAERGGNQPDFFSSGSGSTNKEKPPTPSTSSTNFFAGLASGIGSTNKEMIPTPSASSATSSAPEPTLPAFTFGSSSVTRTAATPHHIPTSNSSIVMGGRAFQLPPLPSTTLPPLAISTPATPAGGLFSSSTSTGDNKEAFTFGTSASSSSFDFDCRVVKPLRRSRK